MQLLAQVERSCERFISGTCCGLPAKAKQTPIASHIIFFVVMSCLLEVSISLVSRDRPELLDHALGLIDMQDYQKELLEVVLVDSSQPPLEAFIRGRWEHRALFQRIRYFHLPEPRTIGEKRNFAVRAAQGLVVIQWDDDDYYGPTRLQAQVWPILRGLASCTALVFDTWYFLESDEFWTGPPEELGFGLSGGHPGTLAFKRSLWSAEDANLQYPSTNFADPDDFHSALVDKLRAHTEVIPRQRVDFVYVRHQHAAAAAAGGLKLGLEECFLGIYYEFLAVRAFGSRTAPPKFLPTSTCRLWAQIRCSRPSPYTGIAYKQGQHPMAQLGKCTSTAIKILHVHLQELPEDDLMTWLHGSTQDGSRRRALMKDVFLKDVIPALVARLKLLPEQFDSATYMEAWNICMKLRSHPRLGGKFRAMAEDFLDSQLQPCLSDLRVKEDGEIWQLVD